MQEYCAYTIFVDESGTDSLKNFKDDDRYFVLAFCIFDKNYYSQEAVPKFQKLKFDTFGHDQKIIHGYDMMNCIGDFECLQDSKIKNVFLNRLTEIIESTNFILISTVIDKKRLIDRYVNAQNPYDLALKYSLERVQSFLHERNQENKIAHIIVESRDSKSNERLKNAFVKIKNGDNWNQSSFNFEIEFVNKKSNSTGLQIADLVAEPIRCKFLRPEKLHQNFRSLENKFYCKGGRNHTSKNFDGYGLKLFPY
ncbi:DUF3800 domain-containing protein [Acinetobacter faecalis]|uniref:DUF3800 domain-containing protein n=1 Tax=Acinetobacter faecalis TaxID=2665161 RepID=A0AB35UZA0_9GAMM|nr:DUF3800 domain-containing protein [Acinetobacter faecalis]MDY6488012.1 DUF3800 domain-containing protein [Acinetobacter faecalis]MDY6490222.1 DUF3800 domain-containing protein [Acinetobacter faecalis]MDY6535631.1 DUF3800 domain-containing protein [Acinetobacter faecalis]